MVGASLLAIRGVKSIAGTPDRSKLAPTQINLFAGRIDNSSPALPLQRL
jgi:hypothetical protein